MHNQLQYLRIVHHFGVPENCPSSFHGSPPTPTDVFSDLVDAHVEGPSTGSPTPRFRGVLGRRSPDPQQRLGFLLRRSLGAASWSCFAFDVPLGIDLRGLGQDYRSETAGTVRFPFCDGLLRRIEGEERLKSVPPADWSEKQKARDYGLSKMH